MPTYTAIHRKKQHTKNLGVMTLAEMEQWEKDNPEWEILCGAPLIHTGFMTGESKSDGWNDVLKKVKKGSGRNNTIKLMK